ncbi:OTU-like cysteine protease family protein [Musa troglodytarum]|uniref:Ubiquitin thioesterase OTU n=1 Tax=Musa troglodytarum TaxID=320322 RepID=A0A9E7G7V3_9LILI|nr:OTU-like cysteine protease family protein [Musa troglodytarum]
MANRGNRPSNEVLLGQLKDGTARFELLQPPAALAPTGVRFFARIGSSLRAGGLLATKKVEQYTVQKVKVTAAACSVKGMANNKGLVLHPRQETDEADELRMAVKEVICDSETERPQYEEALIAITVDESLKQYCQRIERSDFWGGESEFLVLSKLCQQLIIIYIPEHEHTHGTWGNGFIPITQYGSEFGKKSRNGKQRAPVRLVYSGRNHYDLLV